MNIQLSKRMQAVADMALPGYRTADIGCDHGFVSIYLIQAGIAPFVYAADVRPGPLSRAKEHIEKAGLESYITAVLSDGLENVPVDAQNGAQAMIAAGIGGRLTIKILGDWPEKTGALSWVVLEPQSDIHLVRRWLLKNSFCICSENMVYEDGKYYPVLFAVNTMMECFKSRVSECRKMQLELEEGWTADGYSREAWKEACELFGFWPVRQKHPVLIQYLTHTIEKDNELLDGMSKSMELQTDTGISDDAKAEAAAKRLTERMAEIEHKIGLGRQVLAFMKNRQDFPADAMYVGRNQR